MERPQFITNIGDLLSCFKVSFLCLPKDGAELSKNHRMSSCFSLVWFSCFAAHLIGHFFAYITVLDLCFIFEFCKHCNRQRYQTMVPLRGQCNDLKNVQDWFPRMRAVLFFDFFDKFSISLGNAFDFGHAVILFPLLID